MKNTSRPIWRTAKRLRPGVYFICDQAAGAIGSPLPAQGRMSSVWLWVQNRPFRAQLERTAADYATTKQTRGWVWSLSLVRPGDEGPSFHLGPVFLFRAGPDRPNLRALAAAARHAAQS